MILINQFLVTDTFLSIIFQIKITVLYNFIGSPRFFISFLNNYARNIGFYSSEILFRFFSTFL